MMMFTTFLQSKEELNVQSVTMNFGANYVAQEEIITEGTPPTLNTTAWATGVVYVI